MLSSSCSQALLRRPFPPPSTPITRVSNRPRERFPITRSFRISEPHSRPLKKEWKRISCFRHEDFSSEPQKPEYIEHSAPEEIIKSETQNSEYKEHYVPEGVVKSELHNSSSVKKSLPSSLRQLANSVIKAIESRWTVPWTAETIMQVMLLWVAAFCFIGSSVVPIATHMAGLSRESLTLRGQAFFSLLTDVTEGLAGIMILHRCLSRFRPLPPDWFRFSFKGNWYIDVALGCLMFPLVNRLSQFNLKLLPLLPSTPVTLSSVEQSVLACDRVAMALYVIVVSVCAPVWEEIVFRGFLLPSLTKYMPVWCAILVSSIVFALAHFNVQKMLPLIFLGVVMGSVFARSRNLLPSMLLHSLWNSFVFLDLMK
ncbi:CAAX amino terminal protease [Parasponia andersonii]|uniref:CAAX amino terminal protease n=1 Tax=Parasponia andersonii TaxID=3476 RepID=A0A2P5B502_PARAD|nr:CAAX amino terminal protease [Parasponia andersonii]